MSAPVQRASGGRGRPPCCTDVLAARIQELRDTGLSLGRIRDVLNAEGLLTPMGRAWRKSYVDRVLKTKYMREWEEAMRASRSV